MANHTVILSSHILSDVQAICERILVINKGEIIADGAPDKLARSLSEDTSLRVRVNGPEHDVQKLLSAIPGVTNVINQGKKEQSAYEYIVEVAEGADVRADISRRLAERNWPVIMLVSHELSLEDVFIRLTDGVADNSQFKSMKEEA